MRTFPGSVSIRTVRTFPPASLETVVSLVVGTTVLERVSMIREPSLLRTSTRRDTGV
jgi:hypothetical protein